jgi:hypothetical protein
MYISIGGANISNNYFVVTIAPSTVDAAHCYATGQGTVGGVVGTQISFVIQTMDVYNNTIYNASAVTPVGMYQKRYHN